MGGTEVGLLIPTDASCVLRGKPTPGVLTLVWVDGIDTHASDYFRHLHLGGQVGEGSILEYAKIIRAFLAFAKRNGMTTERMTDEFLRTWRDWMRAQPRTGNPRVNDCLGRVFQFLKWLEQSGRIRHVVGVYGPGEATGIPDGYEFPVSATLKLRVEPGGGTRREWGTDLLLGGVGTARDERHTPVEDEIRLIHSSLLANRHGVRDSLLHSWAEETGGRRTELLSIDVSQIPDVEGLADLLDRDEQYALRVVRKNRESGAMIYPTLDLLMRTREYIEIERAIVVASATKRNHNYVDPPALFLSGRTGGRLTPNALTKLSGHAFVEAGVKKASFHRLRARYAQNALDGLLDAIFVLDDVPNMGNWTETIITKLMELMGHASPQSLTPYIQFALQRRLKGSPTTKLQEAERRLRDAELAYEGAAARLRPFKLLHGIAGAISEKRPVDARRLHSELAEELIRLAA